MAHVTYPAVDSRPAGYSRVWIEQILRGELGFAGAVISDDISRAAAGAAGRVGERVRSHLAAGCAPGRSCFTEAVGGALAARLRDATDRPPELAAMGGAHEEG